MSPTQEKKPVRVFTVVTLASDGLTREKTEVVADTICDQGEPPVILELDGEVVAKFYERVMRWWVSKDR